MCCHSTELRRRTFVQYSVVYLLLLVSFLACGSAFTITAQSSVKLYPKTIRIQKGKTKTITGAAYTSPTVPNFNATFAFTSGNTSIASLSNVTVSGDNIGLPSTPPPNLRTIYGNAAGTTTISAVWNGVNSDIATVVVDDPASTPTAVIHGDNDIIGNNTINTVVGEAIEIDGEGSRGVNTIEWSWGDGDKTTELFSATHAYLVAGQYLVTLKVSNRAGQTATSTITVIVSPQRTPTRVINVSTISQLMNAYNNATGGEDIVIPAGTVLTGEIVLPARNFLDYVTIRSGGTLPDIRQRVGSTDAALVTFRASTVGAIPFTIRNGASKIRLIGIKFDPKYLSNASGAAAYYLAQIGEASTQTDVSQNPTKIIFQHCVINPPDDVNVIHGILNDGYKVSIISSWLGNIKTFSEGDSQAVLSLDGRGAHVYNNDFFEAASENIMYGGAMPHIMGLTSSNIEVRRCHFSKRLNWRVYSGQTHLINIKNLFETKNARRVYMEGSVFENHWDAGRSQLFAFVFKTSVGSMDEEFIPWAISEDIVLENDKVNHIYGGITNAIDGYSIGNFVGLKPSHVVVKNTIFDDLSGRWGWPGNDEDARFLQPNNVEDLQVDHVTVIDKDRTAGTAILFVTNNNFRMTVKNSIFGLGGYGIVGGNVGAGIRALNPGTSAVTNGCTAAPTATWMLSYNVMPIYGGDTSCYPVLTTYHNSYPASFASIGFTDLTMGNYKLGPASPYRNTAENGTDPGVDTVVLDQRTACSVAGSTASCLSIVTAPTVVVSGRITSPSGKPISKAVLQVTDGSGNTVRTGLTNPFGYYHIMNIPSGNYNFVITAKNHAFSPSNRSLLQDTSVLDFVSDN